MFIHKNDKNQTTRSRNIIINRCGFEHTVPDESVMRLAAYYTKAFSCTVEHMHMTDDEKKEAIAAVAREYDEMLSARGVYSMVS
ncbi:MAG: hypothetical protein IJM51_02990 [Clostridia bacterium]|nr:hypothetical protein [Clostridia bacterium]